MTHVGAACAYGSALAPAVTTLSAKADMGDEVLARSQSVLQLNVEGGIVIGLVCVPLGTCCWVRMVRAGWGVFMQSWGRAGLWHESGKSHLDAAIVPAEIVVGAWVGSLPWAMPWPTSPLCLQMTQPRSRQVLISRVCQCLHSNDFPTRELQLRCLTRPVY